MAFKKAQIPAVTLYSGLAAAGTSMRITPVLKDLDGNTITLAALGSAPYQLTIDPKISGYEEIIGFTTIIDNGDNTMTLTGLSRDLASSSLATPGTGKQHGAGAVIVLSINPQDIARLASLENDQTFSGLNTYSQFPVGPSAAPTTDYQIANKKYIDDQINAGAAPISTSVAGIGKEATDTQINAGTKTDGGSYELLVNPKYLKDSIYYTQLPTADQKAALAGSGTPSGANKFVTADTDALKQTIANLDTTVTLGGSDSKYPSQNAVKTYVDNNLNTNTGIATRATNAADSTQNIAHGLGRIPKLVRIMVSGSTTPKTNSSGAYNGTNTSCLYVTIDSNGVQAGATSTTVIAYIATTSGNPTWSDSATITVDATNIMLAWTKSGSPTGETMNIKWEAQ